MANVMELRTKRARLYCYHHRVTSDEYASPMELYYAGEGYFHLLRLLPIGSRKSFARCMVALSEVDKHLRSQAHYEYWMEPVQVGAALGERGADACIEGTGKSEPWAACISLVKAGGRVVCLGNPLGGMSLSQDVYWKILRKELSLAGTWNSSFGSKEAFSLMHERREMYCKVMFVM